MVHAHFRGTTKFNMGSVETDKRCKYVLGFMMFFTLLYLNMACMATIWKHRAVLKPQQPNNYLSFVKTVGQDLFPFMGSKEHDAALPKYFENRKKNYSLIMQYKIPANLSSLDIPEELRGGHPLLMTRTYPKTPRKENCHKCLEYVYDTVLRPESCDANGEIKLLIFITTVPDARLARDAIRKTWLSLTERNTKSVRYMWLLGSGWPAEQQAKIVKESQQYGDILQDDYIDSYFNLSIKVMGAYKFALTHCKRAEFILRTADDNHVNIPNVLKLLNNKKRELVNGMFGPCRGGPAPIRDKRSKWAVTVNEWGRPRYPSYCIGTAFGMSAQTMEKLFNASENVPYFVMEDVFFGEVSRQAHIELLNQPYFLLDLPKINPNSIIPCKVPKAWRAIHIVPPNKQFELWKYCPHSKSIP